MTNLTGERRTSTVTHVESMFDARDTRKNPWDGLGKEIKGADVSEVNPLKFRLAQKGTIKIADTTCLQEGSNKIIIEIMNPEAGKVAVKFEDNI